MITTKTITSIFMIPTLKIPRDTLADNDFINGYVKDKHHDETYDDSVCLLFKPADINRFRKFLDDEYERTVDIIEDYDYDGGFVVVIYKLNPEFKEDFELIRQGKYSKTSEKFQDLFPKVIKIKKNGLHRDEISLQFRIFNRTHDLIEFWEEKFGISFRDDMEVWEGFNEENEILDIEKVRKDVEQRIVQ